MLPVCAMSEDFIVGKATSYAWLAVPSLQYLRFPATTTMFTHAVNIQKQT